MAVEAAGALLTVESDDDAALDAVRDALAEAGARLRSLGGRHRRLEDVFDEADPLGEPDSFAEPEPEPRPDAPPP
jgi:hypothetical protein